MHLARTLLLDAPGGLLLAEPRSAGPEVPEKEIQPLSGVKDRILRGFGSSVHTPMLFGGEDLSPGGRWPLPYDQTCLAGVRGQSRCSRCHPRSATSQAVRGPLASEASRGSGGGRSP